MMEESLQDKSKKQKQKTINKEYMIELKHSWWENHQKKKLDTYTSVWNHNPRAQAVRIYRGTGQLRAFYS